MEILGLILGTLLAGGIAASVYGATRGGKDTVGDRRELWQRIAGELGLELTIEDGDVTAEGDVTEEGDGRALDLQIRIWLPEDNLVRTRIRVEVPDLPAGFRCLIRREGDAPWIDLSDPILDRLVRVTADDPSAAARLLDDDELRGDLLAVVHGHPGSTIAEGQVRLIVDGIPLGTPAEGVGELDILVDEALALARSLQRRAATMARG
jgi:hypothetical protein